MINEQFFDLIRVAVGTQNCLSHTPTADEWGKLYDMAKKQSLVGVCLEASNPYFGGLKYTEYLCAVLIYIGYGNK